MYLFAQTLHTMFHFASGLINMDKKYKILEHLRQQKIIVITNWLPKGKENCVCV